MYKITNFEETERRAAVLLPVEHFGVFDPAAVKDSPLFSPKRTYSDC